MQAQAYEGYIENNYVKPLTKEEDMERRLAWLERLDKAMALARDEELLYVPRSNEMREPFNLSDWGYANDIEYIFAELYRKKLTVGEMDILIAAFCVEDGYTLVTDNVKHFKNIDRLSYENWVR